MKEMSFMSKKKRFKFSARVELERLESIALVSGSLIAKLRLIGASYSEYSRRAEITNHCVNWEQSFEFTCKLTANPSTGVLDPCLCRLSVRKELKGGRTHQKLGYADINLAEYASPGPAQTRRYLLEGYSDKTRQDNSLLQVTVSMTRISGELLYKVPHSSNHQIQDSTALALGNSGKCGVSLNPAMRGLGGGSLLGLNSGLMGVGLDENGMDGGGEGSGKKAANGSVASSSSGFSSLTRKNNVPGGGEIEPGHSRNPSTVSSSATGKVLINGVSVGMCGSYDRGYGSYDKTRGHNGHTTADIQAVVAASHARHSSLGSARDTSKLLRPAGMDSDKVVRIDKTTRVDPDDLVNELVDGLQLQEINKEAQGGLQLYIGKDGTAAVGGPGDLLSKDYTAVVLD